MGKKVRRVFKKVDPFTAKVTDRALGDAGLPNISGYNAARESAEREAALTRAQAEEQARIQQQLQNNLQTDLAGENLNTVVAGGTAEQSFSSEDPTRKRRFSGLSSALGGV